MRVVGSGKLALMPRRLLWPLLACVLLAVSLTAGAQASRAGAGAQNLRLYPGMLRDLRAAFDRAHGKYAVSSTGPLLGYHCLRTQGVPKAECFTFHIYYARYQGYEYAVADFWGKATGSTDQPERFKRKLGARFKDVGDSGDPPACLVPKAVARVWAWQPCSRT